MTAQEIFDMVAANLLEQGEPSLDRQGDCVYRSDPDDPAGSLRCAAGVLIKDEDYDCEIEGAPARELIENDRCGMGRFMPHVWLIRDLQLAHDETHAESSDEIGPDGESLSWLNLWKKKMRRVADGHDLSAVVLDKDAPAA